eukprot:scaffold3210_cov4495-Pavlova_lutheri.AAC.10
MNSSRSVHSLINSYFKTQCLKFPNKNFKSFWGAMYAAPKPSKAQTSISPTLWPPCFDRPPKGCWVTSEYGPVERACILSSTK